MSINEIKIELAKVEDALFIIQMADFMNWNKYHEYRARENELRKMLKAAED